VDWENCEITLKTATFERPVAAAISPTITSAAADSPAATVPNIYIVKANGAI
jgi:hypothetical protein